MILIVRLGFSAHARNLGFLHAKTPRFGLASAGYRKKIDLSLSATPRKGALGSHYFSTDIEILQGVALLASRVTRSRSSIPLALLRPP